MNVDSILEQSRFEIGGVIDLLRIIEIEDENCRNKLNDILTDLLDVDYELEILKNMLDEIQK